MAFKGALKTEAFGTLENGQTYAILSASDGAIIFHLGDISFCVNPEMKLFLVRDECGKYTGASTTIDTKVPEGVSIQ